MSGFFLTEEMILNEDSWDYGSLTIGAVERERCPCCNAQKQGSHPVTFVEMLRTVLADRQSTLASVAQSLSISPQYLHDLKEGRRLPSVEVVEKICAWMGRGPKGRLEWHLAGAEAHGWRVRAADHAQISALSAEKSP